MNLLDRLRTKNKKQPTRLIINSEALELRVALVREGRLEEYTVERKSESRTVGNVYKGIVKNIEPGLKALFIEIGLEKNAFLHFWDAIPAAIDSGVETVSRDGNKRGRRKRITANDIPEIYPVGSEVLIQVSKGAIGNKGPRVNTNISLVGRFVVFMPLDDRCGISKKISDPKERERLRKILNGLELPEGSGVILRTNCEGQRARHIIRDLGLLVEKWGEVERIRKDVKAPVCALQEPDLIERTVRDFLTDDIDEIYCDNTETLNRMGDLISKISRRSRKKLLQYSQTAPIFENFGIQKQIDDTFHRQVWLPCGGYIVIDETEALVAIDVNTGRNRGGSDKMDKLILQTNVEAAIEVARQLRLRNMGGLVVVDFIDMRGRRDQNQVTKTMRDCLVRDKARTQVLPISAFGLMEITRQRLNDSITTAQYEPCPCCQGKGSVKTAETMSVDIQRRIHSLILRHNGRYEDLIIIVNPQVLDRLRNQDDHLLVELERTHNARFTFRSDAGYSREQIGFFDAANKQPISE